MIINEKLTILAASNATLGLLACGVVVAAIVATVVLNRRRQAVWMRFARRHGFRIRHDNAGLRVSGTADNYDVTLNIDPDSSDTGTFGVEEVVMSVSLDASRLPIGLKIESVVGIIGEIQQALDNRSITTGNEAFDRDLLVTGASPASVAEWLTDHRQLAFLNLIARHADKQVTLDKTGLHLQGRTAVSRLEVLDDMLDALVEAARSIEIEPGADSSAVNEVSTTGTTQELR